MNDFFALAAKLTFAAHAVENVSELLERGAVARLGEIIVADIKSRHGFYQAGWAPLSPFTIDRKGADTPLLESGELSDSYYGKVMEDPSGSGKALVIGSDMDTALFHEMGYNNARTGTFVPARPVLLPAVYAHEAEIIECFGQAMVGLFAEGGGSDFYDVQQIGYIS
jgi:phage gpG-like protein